ncbi:MAG: hypothetical protein IT259_18520 [Saprospiraceae bacterium]|nr:hypothetical protein [Saprospiraceae bacterium]
MLLKWLFTALAILWLIQALRPYFAVQQRPPQPPPPAPPQPPQYNNQTGFQAAKDDGEYIDYEEIK